MQEVAFIFIGLFTALAAYVTLCQELRDAKRRKLREKLLRDQFQRDLTQANEDSVFDDKIRRAAMRSK